MNPNDPRQPAYDAVFEEIRRHGRKAACPTCIEAGA